jgi:hypothetical protein
MKTDVYKLWIVVDKKDWKGGWTHKIDYREQDLYTDIDEALSNCKAKEQLVISLDQLIEKTIDNIG